VTTAPTEESEASQRERSAGQELGGRGRQPRERAVQRDETLQHPQTVFQVLKRHYARYTPEVVEQVCGVPPEQFLAVCEAVTANSGRERHHRLGLLGRLDAPLHRRPVHPRLGDHPAAARQHGPARRRDHGAARPREHPGLDRHPDAVQPAAGLPADAGRGQHDTLQDYVGTISKKGMKGFWTGADAYTVSLLKAWYGDAPSRRTTSASTCCPS
jgi:formate dehydrogenase major subunit